MFLTLIGANRQMKTYDRAMHEWRKAINAYKRNLSQPPKSNLCFYDDYVC